ncbi:serine/threonine protein kinase [Vibrio parahaemolyticus]|nr:serine/threonine protein kinase [Vibrio parahaemolyticus]TNZ84845.1 serine/threonine protein kinase [Vibrio parahaemolyticus]TOI29032.1 serine/threonine protein kinase [Vibrio parahaemolyticus]TOZ97825.1 serine/threonine protein kinase [Vibrio parahaemolyticus]TPA09579.1 serine/threonine protein kinase [Vibrio parahaemolyticus]
MWILVVIDVGLFFRDLVWASHVWAENFHSSLILLDKH